MEPKVVVPPETVPADDVVIPEVITPQEIREEVRLARLTPRLLSQVADYLGDPQKGEQQLKAFRDLIRMLRLTSIHLTYPSDWVLHVVDNDGRLISTGYLQRTSPPNARPRSGASRAWATPAGSGRSWRTRATSCPSRRIGSVSARASS